MATVAPQMYSSHHPSFLTQSNNITPAASSNFLQLQPDQQQLDQDPMEEQFATLFCRALYNYDAQDASALSFRQGDIIEVLTQQPSGWWDGLLGDERGWFPSNYVEVISDEEADLAFETSAAEGIEGSATENSRAMVDMSQAMGGTSQAANEEWLDTELSYTNGDTGVSNALTNATTSSDFWMPQVTPDGQVRKL